MARWPRCFLFLKSIPQSPLSLDYISLNVFSVFSESKNKNRKLADLFIACVYRSSVWLTFNIDFCESHKVNWTRSSLYIFLAFEGVINFAWNSIESKVEEVVVVVVALVYTPDASARQWGFSYIYTQHPTGRVLFIISWVQQRPFKMKLHTFFFLLYSS